MTNKNKDVVISLEELKKEKCFVCYDKDKRPINPKTGRYTSIKENSWSYEEVVEGAHRYSNVTGIGVILGEYSFGNLCGLDIDNCIDESGIINKTAQEILNQIDSYTEYSPSKKGIHCLFLATKQTTICKNNKLDWCKCLELYDKDRYFTLTEDLIIDKPITSRQNECNLLTDKYFSTEQYKPKTKRYMDYIVISNNISEDEKLLLRGIAQKGQLHDIWKGARKSKDESSNDLAFMNSLRFFSNGNITLMKEYFLKSPYFMQKDEQHKRKCAERSDYLDRTIAKSFE